MVIATELSFGGGLIGACPCMYIRKNTYGPKSLETLPQILGSLRVFGAPWGSLESLGYPGLPWGSLSQSGRA